HYSHVVWLAALVGDGACAIKPELTREVNQDAVAWLSKNYKGRIIFTSTCSVYGANDKPVTENSPTAPLSVYAQTKLAAEQHLYDKNALIFRLGTAFGISDTYARIRMDLAINYMTMNAVVKKQLTVFGGDQWRPFIHVRDIGQTIANNLAKKYVGVFNLATQNSTILKIGKMIAEETKCKINITDQKFQDSRNYNADTTKARKARILPVNTKYTLRYGAKEVKALVLSNRINDLEHEFYSNQKYLLREIEKYENGYKYRG
ncbi:MAG TPA: SDR family oxidoreductase, partial [Patescibacteria group bacterium]|nr:SDR family oxidoreductase [Patescibacteria group bacterium]